MKQRFLIPGSLLMLGSLSLVADQQVDQNGNCCPKPCCVATCCPEIVEDCCFCDVCPPCTQITPNAGPCVKNGADLYIVGAFTYWTAHEDNLVMANVSSPFTTAGTVISQTEQPQPNWRGAPGFKIGIGYDFCHDGWDAFLNYTWFRSNDNKKSVSPTNLNVFDNYWGVNAFLFAENIPPMYNSASAKWNLHLNVFDLELGRNFYISRRIQLRPHFGLKGMWYHQDYHLQFQFIPGGIPTFNNTMIAKMKNWGIGARAGLDTSWHFCRDMSVIGEIAVTALWEHFNATRVDEAIALTAFAATGTPGTFSSLVNLQNSYYTLKPVVEWMLGFRWEMWLGCDEYHLAFDLGWEAQHWFSQNKFIRISGDDTANGDLSLMGLTFRARFDF